MTNTYITPLNILILYIDKYINNVKYIFIIHDHFVLIFKKGICLLKEKVMLYGASELCEHNMYVNSGTKDRMEVNEINNTERGEIKNVCFSVYGSRTNQL